MVRALIGFVLQLLLAILMLAIRVSLAMAALGGKLLAFALRTGWRAWRARAAERAQASTPHTVKGGSATTRRFDAGYAPRPLRPRPHGRSNRQ